MKITKRERFLLFQILEFDINRYLLVNTYKREDGEERADRHLAISEKLISFILCQKYNDKRHIDYRMPVHDYLAEILTDRMDEKIGFPVFETYMDYDEMTRRFFNVIIEHIGEIEKLIKSIDKEKISQK